MGNQQERLRRERLAWLGGILDGEGTLTIIEKRRKNKVGSIYQPAITLVNTDKKIIERCIEILKENEIPHWVHFYDKTKKWKRRWRIEVGGLKRVAKSIPILSEFLVGKREQADILKEFCDLRLQQLGEHNRYSDYELRLVSLIKMLNRKGPS
jgi:hypothetical protein